MTHVDRFCSRCGASLPLDAPQGACPRCLFELGAGLGQLAKPTAAYRSRFEAPSVEELAPYFPQLEILELLGQGGMGAVYKVRQRALDRIVALKILPSQVAADPSFAERFHREARALARLGHPHIVGVYDSGQAGEYYYFLMEFVDGVNLRQSIASQQLSPSQALAVIPQICEALQYAHDMGVVHRDIKPENILLDRQGRVKIADFGLAKLLHQADDLHELTGSHQVMGTPRYMAPEQLEGTRHVDHRADIYSLGVVFYEMLTGELPLGRFPPPSQKATIDARLDRVVLRTLEKEPRSRYQQASEIKTDVDSIRDSAFQTQSRWGARSFEYRSRSSFLGLPLIHIARGFDPLTGRWRIAKGWIAIGDRAIGGLAIGGWAIGAIALGGLAVGGVSVGGLALGLLGGLGGLATGVIAAGGIAIGGLALGGAAIGVVGFGGNVVAFFGAGGNVVGHRVSSPEIPFSPGRLKLVIAATMAASVVVFLTSMALAALLSARRKPPESAWHPVNKAPPIVSQPESTSAAAILAACILFFFGLGLLVVLVTGGTYFLTAQPSVRNKEATIQRPPEVMSGGGSSGTMAALDVDSLRIGNAGPELRSEFATWVGLRDEQISQVNQVLSSSFQEFLELEKQFSERSRNEAGHQVIIVKPFVGPLAEIENRMWTKLDAILDLRQQEIFRTQLRLYSRKPSPFVFPTNDTAFLSTSLPDAARPGLFGWAETGATIELWASGTWRHWKVITPAVNHESRGPRFPEELARFWNAPVEKSDLPDEGADGR